MLYITLAEKLMTRCLVKMGVEVVMTYAYCLKGLAEI